MTLRAFLIATCAALTVAGSCVSAINMTSVTSVGTGMPLSGLYAAPGPPQQGHPAGAALLNQVESQPSGRRTSGHTRRRLMHTDDRALPPASDTATVSSSPHHPTPSSSVNPARSPTAAAATTHEAFFGQDISSSLDDLATNRVQPGSPPPYKTADDLPTRKLRGTGTTHGATGAAAKDSPLPKGAMPADHAARISDMLNSKKQVLILQAGNFAAVKSGGKAGVSSKLVCSGCKLSMTNVSLAGVKGGETYAVLTANATSLTTGPRMSIDVDPIVYLHVLADQIFTGTAGTPSASLSSFFSNGRGSPNGFVIRAVLPDMQVLYLPFRSIFPPLRKNCFQAKCCRERYDALKRLGICPGPSCKSTNTKSLIYVHMKNGCWVAMLGECAVSFSRQCKLPA